MRPVVNSSRSLREAIDLLQMVEMICHSSPSEPIDSESFPWNGVKLAVQESRARIEAVLNTEAQRSAQPASTQRPRAPESHDSRHSEGARHPEGSPASQNYSGREPAAAVPPADRRASEPANGGQSRSIASRIQRVPTANYPGSAGASPDRDPNSLNSDSRPDPRPEQGRIRELDPRLLIGERAEDPLAPTGPNVPK